LTGDLGGSFLGVVTGTLRMIDANLNRAREALRVMEDVARFVLNDAELSGRLKDARHELRGIGERAGLDPGLLALSRDTPGDVGTSQSTLAEASRAGVWGVAIAAGKRAGEALRVLEEALKALGPERATDGPGQAKQLRYRVYDLERALTLALGAAGSRHARQWRLCVLITESLCRHHSWQRVVELAIEGGADCLQVREKAMDAGELLERAWWVVETARRLSEPRSPVSVIVNDRPDVALASGAQGVHLGQSDLPVRAARAIVGFDRVIGVSTSNLVQAQAALRDGADYCGVGPMFATSTKHKPELAGPDYLREYLGDGAVARLPHLAIGGISRVNVHELVAAGCEGVAVSSAVCSSFEPAQACRSIVLAIEDAWARRLAAERALGSDFDGPEGTEGKPGNRPEH
jgi:thiamine-phosphate pyrophosphorylase